MSRLVYSLGHPGGDVKRGLNYLQEEAIDPAFSPPSPLAKSNLWAQGYLKGQLKRRGTLGKNKLAVYTPPYLGGGRYDLLRSPKPSRRALGHCPTWLPWAPQSPGGPWLMKNIGLVFLAPNSCRNSPLPVRPLHRGGAGSVWFLRARIYRALACARMPAKLVKREA